MFAIVSDRSFMDLPAATQWMAEMHDNSPKTNTAFPFRISLTLSEEERTGHRPALTASTRSFSRAAFASETNLLVG